MSDLNSALKLSSSHLGVHLMLAELGLPNPDYDGAIADYKQWLDLAQSNKKSAEEKTIVEIKLHATMHCRDNVQDTQGSHCHSHSAETPPGRFACMNLYQHLGVNPLCSMKDIKQAFHSKVRKHHLDKGGGIISAQYIMECSKLLDPAR